MQKIRDDINFEDNRVLLVEVILQGDRQSIDVKTLAALSAAPPNDQHAFAAFVLSSGTRQSHLTPIKPKLHEGERKLRQNEANDHDFQAQAACGVDQIG